MSNDIDNKAMKNETKIILSDFEQLDWFSKVGKPIDADVLLVSSWREAIKNGCSRKWENIKLSGCNEHSIQVSEKDPGRFDRWNDIVDELKPLLEPIVFRETEKLAIDARFVKKLQAEICWDLLSMLMESEYSDLITPRFYAVLALIYLDGHYPCGWEGSYPKGRMIIY